MPDSRSKVFLDTNVLVYAAFAQDEGKREIAIRELRELLSHDAALLSAQVFKELASVLLSKAHLPPVEVAKAIQPFRLIPCVPDTPEQVDKALSLCAHYGIHFYDALIVAAAESAGCSEILSEDLGDKQEYDGIRVRNPFRVAKETRRK